MTGLDRIIDRILADAKEKARGILESAQADCRRTAEEYAARAEAARAEIDARAEREGKALIARARSQAAMERRNILLSARGEMIDKAFEAAKADLRDTDYGKYRELLTALLSGALLSVAQAEEESRALGDEVAEYDAFEVLMNAEDREHYGAVVVENARRTVEKKIGAARAAKLRLSDKTAAIDGGIILRYGDVEANCSLSMLFAEMRGELEQKAAAALFD